MTISKERLAEIRAAAEKATPGPWGVWTEPTPSKDRAIDELAYQVMSTPDADFAEAVYLLDAAGKCPATTGCGPTSAANAAHIANCDPQTILALLDALDAAEKAEPVAWMASGNNREATMWFSRAPADMVARDRQQTVTPLYAHPVPAVREGWKLVPVEPTEEMIEAGSLSRPYREDDGRDEYVDSNTVGTWSAMIAAAPEAK